MILALAVSHLINTQNYRLVPGVRALEYRNLQPALDTKTESLFHSDWGITQKGFIEYFNSISGYLKKNKIRMFSFDLGPAAEEVEIFDYYYKAKSKVMTKKGIRKKVLLNLAHIRRKFHGDIAFENLNFFPTTAYKYICEPDFIKDIIVENDVHLVLDIAHAKISAVNLKIDKYEYFKKLPLDRVKEIHISAPGIIKGKWRDLHNRPGKEEFEILKYFQTKINPASYILVEYYKNFQELLGIYKDLSNKV